MSKKYKFLKKKEADMILTLVKGGAPTSAVARGTGRSIGTVCLLKKAGSFAKYKRNTRASIARSKAKREAKASGETPVVESRKEKPAKSKSSDITVASNRIVFAINRNTFAIESLVKAWNKPGKKGLFR